MQYMDLSNNKAAEQMAQIPVDLNQIGRQTSQNQGNMLLYMDVLVEITLQFIMASDSNDKIYYGGSD